jgi:hypothetical protein
MEEVNGLEMAFKVAGCHDDRVGVFSNPCRRQSLHYRFDTARRDGELDHRLEIAPSDFLEDYVVDAVSIEGCENSLLPPLGD